MVPLTVKEEEPLAPAVKLNPEVDASVNVPCETESVSESAFVPAAASVIEITLPLAVEKLSDVFSFRLPVSGAPALGGEFAWEPARAGTAVVTPVATAGWMELFNCPPTKDGGGCAEGPRTVADRSCRDSKASTPRPLQIACWTNQASRRFRLRLAPDQLLGLRARDSQFRKNILVRISILVRLRCANLGRETSKGSPMSEAPICSTPKCKRWRQLTASPSALSGAILQAGAEGDRLVSFCKKRPSNANCAGVFPLGAIATEL